MKEHINHLIKVLLVIGILSSIATCAVGQDSTAVDNPLLEKVSYMAWKSRQFDTLIQNYRLSMGTLNDYIRVLQEINDSTNKQIILISTINRNTSLENSLLVEQNRILENTNARNNKINEDCEKANEKLIKRNAKLTKSSTRRGIANIALTAVLAVTVYAIIKDSTK